MKQLGFALVLLGAVISTAAYSQDGVQQRDDTAARAVRRAAVERCKTESTMVAFIKCSNEASTAYFRTIAFPWMDLVFKNQSELLGLAEAVDAGQLSDDRMLLEMKASDERFAQEFNRRMGAEKAALTAELAAPPYVPPAVVASPPPRPNSSQCRAFAYGSTSGTTRTGRFGEYLSNVQRAYQACLNGVQLPPEPSPPITIQQPQQQPTHTMCFRNGNYVMCDTR